MANPVVVLTFEDEDGTSAEINRHEMQEPSGQCRYVLYRDGDEIADRWEPGMWPPSTEDLRKWAEDELEQYAISDLRPAVWHR